MKRTPFERRVGNFSLPHALIPVIHAPRPEMKGHSVRNWTVRFGLLVTAANIAIAQASSSEKPEADRSYEALREGFEHPDFKLWGVNPFWWWEGEPVTKGRITAQMEKFASKGIRSLTILQRAPGHCDPPVFTEKWWEMLNHALREAGRLNMRLFISDHLGYGETGFMERIITSLPDAGVLDLRCASVRGGPGTEVRLDVPEGVVLGVRAYPTIKGEILDDTNSIDVSASLQSGTLLWKVPAGGNWTVVAIIGMVPKKLDEHYVPFSPEASSLYIQTRLEDLANRVPGDMLGNELAGFFGDEHPPLPHYVYTAPMAEIYRSQFGSDITRAVPAQFYNLGTDTIRLRMAYYDACVEATERAYWRPVFDWCRRHGLEYGHDQAQRRNIYGQTDKYIDYIKTMRWYSSPGQDDPGVRELGDRNYYGFKLASSIAALYERPRVWNEAFYHSGIGVSPGDHLAWMTEDCLYGANLYNPHNNFYSLRGATWTHTDGDWFWRQPYWQHYQAFSDYVARLSFLAGRGRTVADVAVHYPGVSVLAEPLAKPSKNQGRSPGDAFGFMAISEALFFSNIENLIIDDDSLLGASIVAGAVEEGRASAVLRMGNQSFSTLVFGPETTVRRTVMERALEFMRAGGNVIFVGRLPTASAESGAEDRVLSDLLKQILNGASTAERRPSGENAGSGLACLFPMNFRAIADKELRFNPRFVHYPKLYGAPPRDTSRSREIRTGLAKVTGFVKEHSRTTIVREISDRILATERRHGDTAYFLLQNLEPETRTLDAVFPVQGVPELWDPWTGRISKVEGFERLEKGTRVRQRLAGNLGYGIVFRQEPFDVERMSPFAAGNREEVTLPDSWAFAIDPTLDNRWGDFRWPPSPARIGAEESVMKYREEGGQDGVAMGWHKPEMDDRKWEDAQVGFGPYWEMAGPLSPDVVLPGAVFTNQLSWRPVVFSKTHGNNRVMSWTGGVGNGTTADGLIHPDFVGGLPRGRVLLRTALLSPRSQLLGLHIGLRQKTAQLWVNGREQPVEYGLGAVPLVEGRNEVFLALAGASAGALVLRRDPPVVKTLADLEKASAPKLEKASWIREANVPGWNSTFLRRTFECAAKPLDARVVVAARPDYQLFVNGRPVLENSRYYTDNTGAGRWMFPRSANITPFVKAGRNTLAVRVARDAFQYRGDPRWTPEEKAVAVAMSARLPCGEFIDLVSDTSWKLTSKDTPGWKESRFEDSAWVGAAVVGSVGQGSGDKALLANIPLTMAMPVYRLGIHMASPLLDAFNEVPEVVYDVGGVGMPKVGWFRFLAPAGLASLSLPTDAGVRVWIDGSEDEFADGKVSLEKATGKPSVVAIRAVMVPGQYGGAAFHGPVVMGLADGQRVSLGPWEKQGLQRFSGIGTYCQNLLLKPGDLKKHTVLDLGRVGTSAEVRVNGKTVGIRMSSPFEYALDGALRTGTNTIEIRVANTTASFFSTTPLATRSEVDTRVSGLIGPVKLIQSSAGEPRSLQPQ